MSTAATAVEAPPPPAKGKKKLIIIIAAVAALVLAGGGGAAFFLMKKKATAEAEADSEAAAADGESHAPAKAAAKHDPKALPVFVPLDPFTVNLADREAERYAQVGVTLEIEDAHLGDQIKSYMPAVRNNILMAISERTASELLGRDGKAQLAERIKRETSRALGYDVEPEEPAATEEEGADSKKAATKKKKKKGAPADLPVKAVHFSNFIIQ
jgi:flagellar protein FliL